MEKETDQTTKQQIGSRVDPRIFAAIEKIANREERTVSNTIERLLRDNPQVVEILEAETAAAV